MKNDTLRIFNMNLCQSLPLVFQEEVVHQGITTYRYSP
jgi:CD36 family